MKKTVLLLGVGLVGFSSLFLFMTSGVKKNSVVTFHESLWRNTSGPGAGFTGAPGESNCTNCHAGAVQDGNNGINEIILSSGEAVYEPSNLYSVVLRFNEGAAKNGFQLVALNESNEMAGSFTILNGSNTQLRTGFGVTDGRQYVTHTATGSAMSEWEFEWEAPQSNDDVTFYVATNRTNSNNGSSGDVVYLSSHTFSSLGVDDDSTVSLKINELVASFLSVGYIPSNHALLITATLPTNEEVAVNVVSLSGQSIHYQNLGQQLEGEFKSTLPLPSSIKSGIYIATIFVGNKPYSKKFMVN